MAIAITGISRRIRAIPSELLWLFACLSLAIGPHMQRLPVWVTILFFCLIYWRFSLPLDADQQPRETSLFQRLLRIVIFIGIVAGIVTSYGTLVGRDAGVALLILLAGMKFLEIRFERDYYITCFLGLFLVLTNFLFTQSIFTAFYMLLVIIVIVCALISFNDIDDHMDTRERLYSATSLILQSFPLMLIIFLLFPRVSGPLWRLPRDASTAMTGISDEMSPGAISQLVLSNEIAFRVKFQGDVPEQSSLYWRGPVLWQTDGFKWVPDRRRQRRSNVTTLGKSITYTVTLEPMDKNWLFGLEMPVAAPEGSRFSHDMQIRTRRSVSKRRLYTLTSYTDFRMDVNDRAELSRALQLPDGYHEQAVELGNSWSRQGLSDRAIVNKGLRLFNEEEFYYTLNPPQLLQDTVDEFLFSTRRGFCEHYAAAFVILMRAAGIPARVVTGYQGGKINPVDGYLVVRQRDAHAWTEVWMEDRGWLRVDPTSAVSPARILRGIENALPQSIIDVPIGLRNSLVARDIWRRVRDTLDAVNNSWNQWVLGYDTERQLRLLNRIGLKQMDWPEMTIWLIALVCLVFSAVSYWLLRQKTYYDDKARGLYEQFCNKLSSIGIHRFSSEGPRDFAIRAIHRRCDLKDEIDGITSLYIDVRYGEGLEDIELLKRHVKEFRPVSIHN